MLPSAYRVSDGYLDLSRGGPSEGRGRAHPGQGPGRAVWEVDRTLRPGAPERRPRRHDRRTTRGPFLFRCLSDVVKRRANLLAQPGTKARSRAATRGCQCPSWRRRRYSTPSRRTSSARGPVVWNHACRTLPRPSEQLQRIPHSPWSSCSCTTVPSSLTSARYADQPWSSRPHGLPCVAYPVRVDTPPLHEDHPGREHSCVVPRVRH